MPTAYTDIFRTLAPNHDPRHVEAYVRLEYSTLDHLPLSTLKREARIAVGCIEHAGIEAAESCAKSFGL